MRLPLTQSDKKYRIEAYTSATSATVRSGKDGDGGCPRKSCRRRQRNLL